MSKGNHVHKYMRVIIGGRKIVVRDGKKYIEKTGGTEVFKCMIPGCSHFKVRELVLGAQSICWKCGGELILNMENTTLKKPTHLWCRKTRESFHAA